MKSNRIFPSWEQIANLPNPLTDGEIALARYLDEHLLRDSSWTYSGKEVEYKELVHYNGWLIFVQPFLNGSRPDVVIYNPKVGVMIFEVKDWNLNHYEVKDGILNVVTHKGDYPIKSPYEQVEHYKENIQTQLVPDIGEAVDKSKQSYGLIKTGIYFHKASTDNCNEKFKDLRSKPNPQFAPLIGYDALRPNNLKAVVPDSDRNTSIFWNKKWNEELLFWLIPPFHSIEQGILLTLRGNQSKIAEPAPGHHRVRGVAGSGKTQAIAYRAAKLASMNLDVLVITFNITLWHYIRDMIKRAPFNFGWNRLTFTHFHGFCKDRLNQFEQKWPFSPQNTQETSALDHQKELETFFRYTVPEAVKNAIDGKSYQKYDAVLIDEGQDYYYQWYDLLSSKFLTNRDELIVVSDKKQNIYQREMDWLDKRVTQQGLEKFKDPYIDLTTTYRMPANVAKMSNRFSETFKLNQDIKLSKVERTQNFLEHIVWLNITHTDWKQYVYNAYRRMTHVGEHPSDIVVLIPTHGLGKECVDFFKEKGIEVNHVFEQGNRSHKTNKKIFWMGDSRLKMCTIHSFKGWELLNVILYIPFNTKESDEQMDAIIYTAITRTRANLIVLNANPRYTDFGEPLPKSWNMQNTDKP